MRVSMLILILVFAGVFLIPIFWPMDPMRTHPEDQIQPPGDAFVFGSDFLGRDVLSRVLYGGQRTLLIASLATFISIVPGALIGIMAAGTGKLSSRLIVVFINAILAFPNLLLALVVLTVMGQGVMPVIVATGFSQIAPYALVTRSAAISVRTMTFVQASEALGATRTHVLWKHILPNIRPTLAAYAGVIFAYSIINSAALSFLGLAGEPGVPDWGVMLAEGRAAFRVAPWVGLAPGLAITITVIAINRLVDNLLNGY